MYREIGKEPVLMLNELRSEKYIGGSAAIANLQIL